MRASGVGVAEAAGEGARCGRLCSGRADCQLMNITAAAQRIIRSAKDGVTASIPVSEKSSINQVYRGDFGLEPGAVATGSRSITVAASSRIQLVSCYSCYSCYSWIRF